MVAPGVLGGVRAVRRLAAEKQIDLAQVQGTGPGGRITKGDLILFLEGQPAAAAPSSRSVRAMRTRTRPAATTAAAR